MEPPHPALLRPGWVDPTLSGQLSVTCSSSCQVQSFWKPFVLKEQRERYTFAVEFLHNSVAMTNLWVNETFHSQMVTVTYSYELCTHVYRNMHEQKHTSDVYCPPAEGPEEQKCWTWGRWSCWKGRWDTSALWKLRQRGHGQKSRYKVTFKCLKNV